MLKAKTAFLLRQKSCCNPFGDYVKPKTAGLRAITRKAIANHPDLNLRLGQKICDICRKKMMKTHVETVDQEKSPTTDSNDTIDADKYSPKPGCSEDSEYLSQRAELSILNQSLQLIGESPVRTITRKRESDNEPDMKDYISVTVDGIKQHARKHLMLCNLHEAYEFFKELHPDVKVGFSKFAELHPRQCVLAGSSGTHSICVCTTHQNIKLMFTGCKSDSVTKGEFKHYRHCLAAIQCNPPRIECFFGKCLQCPGTDRLREKLERNMQEDMIAQIQYKQWTSTDRSNLETRVQTVPEFMESFESSLCKLLLHDFIAKQQVSCLQSLRRNLEPGVILVIADFAENYSFVVQDASQSFHWNNLQATIHPFVYYYKSDEQDSPVHNNLVIISECNIHDTVAVHLYQKQPVQFLTNSNGQSPRRICYFSGGCAAQYKNRKNFINLCHHEEDFGIPAEWHFFATSHGKGPSDGLGGTIKRLAARASLQRPYENQITTPQQLFEFAQSELKNINCQFVSTEQYKQESQILKDRFEVARTIPGTQKLHYFCPISKERVRVKTFSSSDEYRDEHISLTPAVSSVSAINGYVTVAYDNLWWLACVKESISESHELQVTFLHPHGPAKSYTFPEPPDILTIDYHDVLTSVHPVTATGCTYSVSDKETKAAMPALKKKKLRA
ncbi:uncharacterized protein LOC119727986 [Xyrichtys novacula]|uniref:Uncharacterized protein LOC119727986 n=1 Tax=Xyrichtys novacula TaxID=13765 RepID=A0AAV1FLD5_XYRNO|nr:uncharacterized protein LOC119727986 [Xyrichtys novacula]